jgi:hypothetical protein
MAPLPRAPFGTAATTMTCIIPPQLEPRSRTRLCRPRDCGGEIPLRPKRIRDAGPDLPSRPRPTASVGFFVPAARDSGQAHGISVSERCSANPRHQKGGRITADVGRGLGVMYLPRSAVDRTSEEWPYSPHEISPHHHCGSGAVQATSSRGWPQGGCRRWVPYPRRRQRRRRTTHQKDL